MAVRTYRGAVHYGADPDLAAGSGCNCSICAKRTTGARGVKPETFHLLRARRR